MHGSRLLLVSTLVLLAAKAGAATYIVRPDGTGDFPNVQAAITACSSGDVVQLTNGTFSGPGNRDLDVMGKSIEIIGNPADPTLVVIDCGGSPTEPHAGFVFDSGESTPTALRGVTVENGYLRDWNGAGILIVSSSPTIEDCIIRRNTVERISAHTFGAGMHLHNSTSAITRCAFLENHGVAAGSLTVGGGGISSVDGHPVFTACRFESNDAQIGAGVYVSPSDAGAGVTLRRCSILNNTARDEAGGLFLSNSDSTLIEDCLIAGNRVTSPGGRGGAAYILNDDLSHIAGSTIANNSGGNAAVYVYDGAQPTIEHSIIALNSGLGVLCSGGSPDLSCCDIFGNSGGDNACGQSSGIIHEDPLFCDAGNGVFSLRSDSPCLFGACGQIGALGIGCFASEPVVRAVADVGNDEGRQVRITWLRSGHDGPGDPVVTGYGIYLRQDQYKQSGGAEVDAARGREAGLDIAGWDYVGYHPARGDSAYQLVVTTRCDSTAAGICWSTYFVSAMTAIPWQYYDSSPGSGYSVDNLAPQAPSGLLASAHAGGVSLTWDMNDEPDLNGYSVYRGTADTFESAQPIGWSPTHAFEDGELQFESPGIFWYWVSALDISGNESQPCSDPISISTGVNPPIEAVTRFAIRSAQPNPFQAGTTVTFAIPAGRSGSEVRVDIYDSSGRLVRNLLNEVARAGVHTAMWNGRDDRGYRAASGVYFYRVQWNGEVLSDRVVLTR